jgi:serine/threonine protein kinase
MHCDLKPANVLLKSTAANRRGYVCKLCDFGMSRVLDKQHATHVSTQTYGVRFAGSFAGHCHADHITGLCHALSLPLHYFHRAC